MTDLALENMFISESKIMKYENLEANDLAILLEGLISLEVLKWDVPSVDVSAEKSWDDPENLDIDVDVTVDEPAGVYITHLGIEFVSICTE